MQYQKLHSIISFSVDMKLYQNSGYSMDLSMGTLSRAVDHSWNCYNFPNFRVKGPGFPDTAYDTDIKLIETVRESLFKVMPAKQILLVIQLFGDLEGLKECFLQKT